MSFAAVAAVQSRMSAIEARFDAWSPTGSPVLGAVGTSDATTLGNDFEAMLRTADEPAPIMAGTVSAPAVRAVPIISASSRGVEALQPRADVPVSWNVTAPLTTEGMVDPATPFAEVFNAAGATYGVPPRLLAAVGWVESRYQLGAVSPDGAIGLMQIMPETAASLGVDPTDPVSAIDGAARLLASNQRRFGSWDLALAAYHSGPGAVAAAEGGTLPSRAAEYVGRVRARLEQS